MSSASAWNENPESSGIGSCCILTSDAGVDRLPDKFVCTFPLPVLLPIRLDSPSLSLGRLLEVCSNILSSWATLSSSCRTRLTGLPLSYVHSRLPLHCEHEGFSAEHLIRRFRQYKHASPLFKVALPESASLGMAMMAIGRCEMGL